MKVTVCELSDDPRLLEKEWESLVAHVKWEASQLVLLPEMPFYPWVAKIREFDSDLWKAAVDAHKQWMRRFKALAPAVVAGTRPVIEGNRRRNEGFLWESGTGYRKVHDKYYLPDEADFWEASWYGRGEKDFSVAQTHGVTLGFLICTEIWFTEHARNYAGQGIHLLLCPRATPRTSTDKWIAGGRTAAVVSGAFCLSSNRGRPGIWGGNGWIIDPEEGELLGLTSRENPFLSLDIDLDAAVKAKRTYPRYVRE